MATINQDFPADLASIGMKFCATGFTGDCRFVSVKISNGVIGGAEFTMLVTPDEARVIADTFVRAAAFAEPRIVEAADLGLLDEAA
jgi:hypothetical protein